MLWMINLRCSIFILFLVCFLFQRSHASLPPPEKFMCCDSGAYKLAANLPTDSINWKAATLEAWVYIGPGHSSLMGKRILGGGTLNSPSPNRWSWGSISASTIDFVVTDGATSEGALNRPVGGNSWRHLAFVRAGVQGFGSYIDGDYDFGGSNPFMENEQDATGVFTVCTADATPLLITEVRLWNKTRTTAEILSTWNTTLSGTEPGLYAYWPLTTNFLSGNGGIDLTNSTGAGVPEFYPSSGCNEALNFFGLSPNPSQSLTPTLSTTFSSTPSQSISQSTSLSATVSSTSSTSGTLSPALTPTGSRTLSSSSLPSSSSSLTPSVSSFPSETPSRMPMTLSVTSTRSRSRTRSLAAITSSKSPSHSISAPPTTSARNTNSASSSNIPFSPSRSLDSSPSLEPLPTSQGAEFSCDSQLQCDQLLLDNLGLSDACLDIKDSCSKKVPSSECLGLKAGCKVVEYDIVIGQEGSKGSFPLLTSGGQQNSEGGVIVAQVDLDTRIFPAGTVISLRWSIPNNTEEEDRSTVQKFQMDFDGKESVPTVLISAGILSFNAISPTGNPITQFEEKVCITMSVGVSGSDVTCGANTCIAKDSGLSELSSEDIKNICLAWNAREGEVDSSTWTCEAKPDSVREVEGSKGVYNVEKCFNHATSFAVLLGVIPIKESDSGSARKGEDSNALWISSVVLVIGVPILMVGTLALLLKFKAGKAWFYGYKGMSMAETLKKLKSTINPS